MSQYSAQNISELNITIPFRHFRSLIFSCYPASWRTIHWTFL